MSLRLLIDENSQAKPLVGMLRSAGHDVSTTADERLMGADDDAVLVRAHALGRCLVTRNARHFECLHKGGAEHSGILAIYHGPVPKKNMSSADIVNAIDNLNAAGIEISGQFISLNAWNY